jgi:26S proteasome regulatory subunit N3
MDVDQKTENNAAAEYEIYLTILVLVYLIDHKKNEAGAHLSKETVERIRAYNRRSLDLLGSSVYYYFSLFHEKLNKLAEIRPALLALHRTTTLRRDEHSQVIMKVIDDPGGFDKPVVEKLPPL